MAIINGRGRVGIRRPSVAAAPSIVLDGLKLYLDAGNAASYAGTGTVWTDLSGNGNNGTLVNSGSGLSYDSANGGSLQFDGVNDHIRILTLNTYLNNVTKFTYEIWFRVNNPASSTLQTIFSFGQNDLYAYDIMFFTLSGLLYFQINNGVDGDARLSYTRTGWNNISVVFDGTQTGNSNRMKVYLNGALGVLDFNTYTVPTSTSNSGFTKAGIGAYSTVNYNGGILTGNISVAKLYNKALSAAEVLQNYNAALSRFYPVVSDADAQAFVVAAGLTSSVQAGAVNTLVTSMKTAGVWAKMKAVYPMVGGSAASHKWNLKDPRDLDAAFRLTFTSGWIHSSTGALANGSSDYANTFYNLQLLNQNNTHLSLYQINNYTPSASGSIDMGAFDEGSANGAFIASEVVTGLSRARLFKNALDYSLTDNRGYFLVNTNSTNTKYYINNVNRSTIANSGTFPLINKTIYIGGINTDTGRFYFSSGKYTFATIGDGLTDAESASFYTAVQAYQTALGRAV